MKRRQLLQAGLFGAGITLIPSASFGREKVLRRTPTDFEGPFYPVDDRSSDTADLLRNMTGRYDKELILHGFVRDEYGDPVSGIIVDIWHTDPDGRYNHPADRTPGPLLEDFAYFGKAETGERGQYEFRTLIPGAYGGRPAHIHYKVWRDAETALTSQIYFNQTGGARGASRYHNLEERQLADIRLRANLSNAARFDIII